MTISGRFPACTIISRFESRASPFRGCLVN